MSKSEKLFRALVEEYSNAVFACEKALTESGHNLDDIKHRLEDYLIQDAKEHNIILPREEVQEILNGCKWHDDAEDFADEIIRTTELIFNIFPSLTPALPEAIDMQNTKSELSSRFAKLYDMYDEDEYENPSCDDFEGVAREFFEEKGIPYEISIDDMFDSPGLDVSSFAVAWVENGLPQLHVECVEVY